MDEFNNVRAKLKEWHGAGAELWSYVVSHSRMVLRLRTGDRKEVFVVMDDVSGVWGIVAWPNAELSIIRDQDTGEIVVRDGRAGFVVGCGRVILTTDDPSFGAARLERRGPQGAV